MTDTAQDVLIVGAGPAGLAAALVLGRQQRRVTLIDAGHPRNAPVKEMHMYLSREGSDPAEFRRLARAEVSAHSNVHVLTGVIVAITGEAGAFEATLDGGRTIAARTVLLAGGVLDRLPDLPGLVERWGTQVSHCAYCHGYESVDKAIAVLAGSVSDIVLARYVSDRFSDDVTVYAGGLADAQDALAAARAAGIRVETRQVLGLGGDRTVTLELDDGTRAEADVVFHRPPVVQSSTLAADLGCELTDQGLTVVEPTMVTSVPGIYAAGDAATLRGAVAPAQFVASAAADGQRAAVWIEQELFARILAS